MNFWDSGPIFALLDLLFDILRSFFPSWFPRVGPDDERVVDRLRPLIFLRAIALYLFQMTRVLRVSRLQFLRQFRGAMEALRNDISGPTSVSREILQELKDLRADISRSNENLEQIFQDIRQMIEGGREKGPRDADEKLSSLMRDVGMIQDAFSKLPVDLSTSLSEVLGRERIGANSSEVLEDGCCDRCPGHDGRGKPG
jgi:hypothetical protein